MKLALERMNEVTKRTGLARATIYRRMGEGTFPQPVKLGTRAIAWRSSDVDAWIESLSEINSMEHDGDAH
jgi:prophage regulatory protein